VGEIFTYTDGQRENVRRARAERKKERKKKKEK
jgi:hypothetical protein